MVKCSNYMVNVTRCSLCYWYIESSTVLASILRPKTINILKILIYLFNVYLIVLIVNKNSIIHYFNSYCKRNRIQISATYLYLKNVLCCPEDDRLRSKHLAVMWHDCIYFISVMIYCCVLTVYSILYKNELQRANMKAG